MTNSMPKFFPGMYSSIYDSTPESPSFEAIDLSTPRVNSRDRDPGGAPEGQRLLEMGGRYRTDSSDVDVSTDQASTSQLGNR